MTVVERFPNIDYRENWRDRLIVVEERCRGCPWPAACEEDRCCWRNEQVRRDQERSAAVALARGRSALDALDAGVRQSELVDDPDPGDVGALQSGLSARAPVEVDDDVAAVTAESDDVADTPTEVRAEGGAGAFGAVTVDEDVEEPVAHETDSRRTRSRYRWERAEIIAAIQQWATERGAPPKSDQWRKALEGLPSSMTVAKHFGTWAAAIEAAGFPRPTRGGRHSQSVSVVKPELEVAADEGPAEIRELAGLLADVNAGGPLLVYFSEEPPHGRALLELLGVDVRIHPDAENGQLPRHAREDPLPPVAKPARTPRRKAPPAPEIELGPRLLDFIEAATTLMRSLATAVDEGRTISVRLQETEDSR